MSLSLSNLSRKESTIGQMINILSIDTYGLTEFPHHANMGWSCLFNIILGMALLYSQIGISGIAGTLIMILILPLTSFLTNKVFFKLKD